MTEERRCTNGTVQENVAALTGSHEEKGVKRICLEKLEVLKFSAGGEAKPAIDMRMNSMPRT